MSWYDRASCRLPEIPTRMFYDDIWTNEWTTGRPPKPIPHALARARAVCMTCPVRRECLVEELAVEGDSGVAKRYGLRALMTPHQRAALAKRGPWPDCPRCGRPADPAEYLDGRWRCCRQMHDVTPLSDDGDEWHQRHSDLAARVVEWLREQTRIGDELPSAASLAKMLSVRTGDMRRVYKLLIDDGTIRRDTPSSSKYHRAGRLAAQWQPAHFHVPPVVYHDRPN